MKILVVLKDLYVGGIQKSCVNFVNFLTCMGKDVDLLLFNKNGPLLSQISSKVNIKELKNNSLLPFSVSQKEAKSFGRMFYLKRTITAVICKTIGNKFLLKRSLKKQPKLNTVYDIAISFAPSTGTKSLTVGCAEYVLQKTSAKQKWIFVHSDYDKSGLNEPYATSIFEKFDKILCVSNSCAEQMKQSQPLLKQKIDFLYNICDEEDIIKKASEEVPKLSNSFNLITVARLSEEKGHIRLLEQLKKLKQEGFEFVYTIVGDGNEYDAIKKYIIQNEMDDYVKMLGNKNNPYPYMKEADLFILPSFHESYGLVLIDSFILGVPALSTNTCSAEEVVGDNGFICENSGLGLYEKIKELLTTKSLVQAKKEKLSNYKFPKNEIARKLNELFGA